MKKLKFSVGQFAFALRMAKTGIRVAEVCMKLGIEKQTFLRYCFQKRDDRALRMRIREIAETRIRYAYFRIHVPLQREGWHKAPKRAAF